MAGKFSGVLLASDYDNTLLNTEVARTPGVPTPHLSRRTREALERFMDQGGRFALATGRALASIAKFIDEVPTNCPAIICNGAALYDFRKGEYLDCIFLEEDVRRYCQEILDASPGTAMEAYPLESVIHAVRPNRFTKQHENLTLTSVQAHDSLLEVPGPVTKMMFENDHQVLLGIQEILLRQSWIGSCEVFFSAPTLLELTRKGANKGGMVRRLAKRLGVRHVFCAGDEANDIPMLTLAEEGFAPENCIPEVRACGATIVRHAREGAIGDVVELLDKRF